MSKDDFEDLGSAEPSPLDEDLLQAGGPAELTPQPGVAEETVGFSPGLAPAEPSEEKVEEGQEAGQPEEAPGLLARLAESDPYTVMLVVSLVALLIGICCLLLEWGAYGFDVKPDDAGQPTTAGAMFQPAVDAIRAIYV